MVPIPQPVLEIAFRISFLSSPSDINTKAAARFYSQPAI